MDDVARHLSVSKKTLYEYFHDKRDLVGRVLDSEHAAKCGIFESIRKKDLNAIEEMFHIYLNVSSMIREFNPSMEYDIRKYYPDLYLRMREKRRETMLENTNANLQKGIREGLYRKDLNASVIARLHLFRIESITENEIFSADELNSFETFHELFVYHLYGIVSEKGRTFFDRNFGKFIVQTSNTITGKTS
jgi:AcrR family transcriptional regulator